MNPFYFILIVILVAAGLFSLYLFLIRPDTSRRADCLALSKTPFAHRGLWDMEQEIAENSMSAFRRAVEAGYGIELDVHLTKDGHVVVFHDDTLSRMCGRAGQIEDLTLSQLSDCRLAGTNEGIPLFSDVLKMVRGAVPLLVELKLPRRDLSLCARVMQLFDDYRGPYLVESFNPLGLYWFRKKRPEVLRGQLSARFPKALATPWIAKLSVTSLIVNALGRPHFVAYSFRHAGRIGFSLARAIYHVPAFAWTIRRRADARACRGRFDGIIFEQFLPGDDPWNA